LKRGISVKNGGEVVFFVDFGAIELKKVVVEMKPCCFVRGKERASLLNEAKGLLESWVGVFSNPCAALPEEVFFLGVMDAFTGKGCEFVDFLGDGEARKTFTLHLALQEEGFKDLGGYFFGGGFGKLFKIGEPFKPSAYFGECGLLAVFLESFSFKGGDGLLFCPLLDVAGCGGLVCPEETVGSGYHEEHLLKGVAFKLEAFKGMETEGRILGEDASYEVKDGVVVGS